MRSIRFDQKFEREVVHDNLPNFLDLSLSWISENMGPEDVFCADELRKWAIENGYVEKQND